MRSTLVAATLVVSLLGTQSRGEEKLDLKMHWTKGDTHHVSVSLDQSIEQTLGDAQQQTNQTIGVTYDFTVTEVDPNGNATVSVRYDSVAFHAKTPSGVVDYDPTKPATGPMPVTVTALAALVGQSYAVTVDPRGRIVQVAGAQKMLDGILAHLNVSDGVLHVAVEKMIRQQLSEQNLKQSLRDVFAPFPNHPVAIGDSWTRKSIVTQGFAINVETTYVLKSHEDGIAVVSVAGKVATSAEAMMDLGAVKMDYDLKGEQTGSLEIQESTGWARQASISQTLAGKAILRGPNVDRQIIPMTIRSQVKSEEK